MSRLETISVSIRWGAPWSRLTPPAQKTPLFMNTIQLSRDPLSLLGWEDEATEDLLLDE